jgi:hypothetical protein
MLSGEQAAQIGCVVRRIKMLMQKKVKGSLTVHFDGSGSLGRNFETHIFEGRDEFSSEKWGIPIEEDEFVALITKP